MRLFQNSGYYKEYLPRLRKLTAGNADFASLRASFLNDRYGATHLLSPILNNEETAFFTNGDDQHLQSAWAREHRLPAKSTGFDILRCQIEEHRTEVFYNLDPVGFPSSFIRSLPGCVKRSIAWRGVPDRNTDLSAYDMVVCNFPTIISEFRNQGVRSELFFPAHDPAMDEYAKNTHRPIDVLFVGGYSHHHLRRARLLDSLADLSPGVHVQLHLTASRLTRLSESPIGRMLPLRKYRRPPKVVRLTEDPIFGRELYSAVSKSKIVFNCAIDEIGSDRGNMRCWETLGIGALMVSDEGNYPPELANGHDFVTYRDPEDLADKVRAILKDYERWGLVAKHGYQTISTIYSKSRQWAAFQRLLESI